MSTITKLSQAYIHTLAHTHFTQTHFTPGHIKTLQTHMHARKCMTLYRNCEKLRARVGV